ncbi:putative ribonuclease H-like domain-containing protein [Rosa chinensis]|uniref:Putative ribonuclease H-like domain-containing protein n=1 Tax=Rosa chinensis TaxID=74649 RepID=A0A2P6SH84_ROSCH|nr:putative ribonuclease H-like domain-containing protein [Rosa chinensis]
MLMQSVLERANFYSRLASVHFVNFIQFIQVAMERLSVNELMFLIVMLWVNWKERNEVLHGGAIRQSEIIFNEAFNFWSDLIASQTRADCRSEGSVLLNQRIERHIGWQVPPDHSLKLNCDASVIQNGKGVGVGAVLRAGDGKMIWALGLRVQDHLSPLAAELIALKVGLQDAMLCRPCSLMVETDCLEAVRLVVEPGECLAEVGVLVEEVRSLLLVSPAPRIEFVPREANQVAHSIANFVAREVGRFKWFEVGPPWLMKVISNDLLVTYNVPGVVRDSSIIRPVNEGGAAACHTRAL